MYGEGAVVSLDGDGASATRAQRATLPHTAGLHKGLCGREVARQDLWDNADLGSALRAF
jgi:hypothetical protein